MPLAGLLNLVGFPPMVREKAARHLALIRRARQLLLWVTADEAVINYYRVSFDSFLANRTGAPTYRK